MYISAWLSILFLAIAVVCHIIGGGLRSIDNKTDAEHTAYVVFDNLSYTADALFIISFVVFLFTIINITKIGGGAILFFVIGVIAAIIGGVLYTIPLKKTIIEAYIFFGIAGICCIGFLATYFILIFQHYKKRVL